VTGGSTGDIGNWDATKWEAVRIGEELTDLKEAISETNERFDTIENSYTDLSMWSQGALDVLSGAQSPSSARIRSGYLPKCITDIIV
jgi:hypothetical protein